MKKILLFSSLFFVVFALEVNAQNCTPVVVNSPYNLAYGHNYNYAHQNYNYQVLAATFVPVPLVVPTYAVQYGGDAHLQREIQDLRRDILNLRQPATSTQPQAAVQPQATVAAPKIAEAPKETPHTLGDILGQCVRCHDATTKAKGNGFVITENGQTKALSDNDALKILRAVTSGQMPPGAPLANPDRLVIAQWVAGTK